MSAASCCVDCLVLGTVCSKVYEWRRLDEDSEGRTISLSLYTVYRKHMSFRDMLSVEEKTIACPLIRHCQKPVY